MSGTKGLISPHGDQLINQVVENVKERQELLKMAKKLACLELNEQNLADLECIAMGVYSPLTGFMNEMDYQSVIDHMTLANDLAWTIPVTLSVSPRFAEALNYNTEIALLWKKQLLAVMTVESMFQPDKNREVTAVCRTDDLAHPGVQAVMAAPPIYIGGPIRLLNPIPHKDFSEYRLTPKHTRKLFQEKGWKTVAGFQTHNPIYRAHEYLQKIALEMVDGLFINPLVGKTKSDDIPADVRMKTYEVILDEYYPKNRVALSVFPAAMRYAGPREAVMHAIAQKNYGCTHFILGRDHAGVDNYYGTYDAQDIFDEVQKEKIVIEPLKFEHAFYCKKCNQMGTQKTCPHEMAYHIDLSNNKVNAMLEKYEILPAEFSRPEVAKLLIQHIRKKNKLDVEIV